MKLSIAYTAILVLQTWPALSSVINAKSTRNLEGKEIEKRDDDLSGPANASHAADSDAVNITTPLGGALNLRYDWSSTSIDETAVHMSMAWCLGGFSLYKPGKQLNRGHCTSDGFEGATYTFDGVESTSKPRSLQREILTNVMWDAYEKMKKQKRYKQVKIKIYDDGSLAGSLNIGAPQSGQVDGDRDSNYSSAFSELLKGQGSQSPTLDHDLIFQSGPGNASLGLGLTELPNVNSRCDYDRQQNLPLATIAGLMSTYYWTIVQSGSYAFDVGVSEGDIGPDTRSTKPEENVGLFVGFKNTTKRTRPPFYVVGSLIAALMKQLEWMQSHNSLLRFVCAVIDGGVPIGDVWTQGDYQRGSSNLGGFGDTKETNSSSVASA